jgi:hypothetical protein
MTVPFELLTPSSVETTVAAAVREATGAAGTEPPLSSERVARALKLR